MPRLVVVGDSFARGAGATSRSKSFPVVLARRLGWDLTVVAGGGAGFIATGRHRGSHRVRQWRVPRGRDLVVIQSSPNDRFYSANALAEAMDRYLRRLGQRSPVVITGAIWCGPEGIDGLPFVTAAARELAERWRIPFIDATNWFEGEDMTALFHADGHPTDRGHEAIAVRLEAAISHLTP